MTRDLAALLALTTLAAACVATPLPTPPTADPERMSLSQSGQDEVTLEGEEGAVRLDGPALGLRVTGPAAWTQVALPATGQFAATLPGTTADTYYLEAVLADRDLFLVAVTGVAGGGPTVRLAEAGGDRDGDGSPDAVDCAPDDPAQAGRRCLPDCVPEAEICDGLDNDCDGLVDEDCGSSDADGDGFTTPEDCDDGDATVNPAAPEICDGVDNDCDGEVDESCSGACATDSDCAGGTCQAGVCVCPAGQRMCAFRCVHTDSDPENCGSCGEACAAGETCLAGTCT